MPSRRHWWWGVAGLTLLTILLLGYTATMPPPKRTETIFVYGTLTNPVARLYACRCRTPLTPVTVEGWQKNGRNILRDRDAAVTGGLIYVSEAELGRLDHYERVPKKYRRETIVINGAPVWVYLKNDPSN